MEMNSVRQCETIGLSENAEVPGKNTACAMQNGTSKTRPQDSMNVAEHGAERLHETSAKSPVSNDAEGLGVVPSMEELLSRIDAADEIPGNVVPSMEELLAKIDAADEVSD